MDFGDKFYEVYSKIVLPKLKVLEPQRIRMINILFIKEVILFILMLLSAFAAYKLYNMNILVSWLYVSPFKGSVIILGTYFIMPGITIICGVQMYQIFKNTVGEFKKLVKQECIKFFVNEFSMTWQGKTPSKSLPLHESNIFPAYSEIEYDDTFQGEYKNTEFNVHELKLILTDSKKNKETKFNGIVICLSSNKTVKAQTIITSKWDERIRNRGMTAYSIFIVSIALIILGIAGLRKVVEEFIYNYESIKAIVYSMFTIFGGLAFLFFGIFQVRNEMKLQKVKLEDLTFDKKYNVYSEDQIEARYLITTAFMERLKNFQTAFGTKNIKCSFFNDKVMFAISTDKDIFEIGNIFEPLTRKKQINRFYDEISSLYNMIDYFKLTQNTGL